MFPNDIDTFVDLFGGGFNVGINVNANKIYYNDTNSKVVDIFEYFKVRDKDLLLEEIHYIIDKYKLSKTNQEGYTELRDYYNNEKQSPIVLYMLICHAFNYQIRFNSKGKFNMPFGKDRSCFNPTLEEKFCKFIDQLHKIQVDFYDNDFKKLKVENLKSNDLVYCDPPYLNSTATYNENGGWTVDQENELRNLLVNLNDKNIKFALSNNLTTNTTLQDWAEQNQFNIHYLSGTYSNCNYQKKDKITKDIEVLITNY
ncbi:Site-specific DNA-methyltransferase (adenine-specific) [Ruminococcaceae bacterium BL-6]|nr:Site-specific DNA-methyltransferase (adenine-specific) [Ruminococcaceae bacterium BL-6]